MRPKKYRKLLLKCLVFAALFLVFAGSRAFGQGENISGPTCVTLGVQYSYTLSCYPASFTYVISGGTLSTGGTSGSHVAGTVTLLITWSSSTGKNIALNSSAGNINYPVSSTTSVSGGSITSGQTQSINYNTLPAAINCGVATGGACSSPSYSYQWQSSPNNVTYTNISGATSQNLTFSSALTATTYYRRYVVETVSGGTAYSNVATITVYSPLVSGSIAPSSQSIASSYFTGVSRGKSWAGLFHARAFIGRFRRGTAHPP